MASNVPIVRQIAWLSVLVQTLLIISLAFLYRFIFPESYFLLAIATFLVIFFLLRTLVPAQHRKGVRLFKQKKFEEAIPCFRASYEFFSKRRWIDKYRFITLLSSSRISYLEMALLNEAFCISQLEKKAEAIEKYENVLKEFPDSEMAISALKLLK
jgi:tetratricopeptide (TPR) repeat protein